MAAVQTRSERALNRVAIAAVLVITLIFLAPIYWITSTAFKPRNLATTIPPTVLFEPELSPFVKLFTKRSQLRGAPTPEEYAAAPGGSGWCSTAARRSFAPAAARCSPPAIRTAS